MPAYFPAVPPAQSQLDQLENRLIVEYGVAGKLIETFFDLFDYDEGRNPAAEKPWLRV
ncbi:MAG: hypothetical protein JO069_04045 [Verrucomicrobia bacterium]|nr:hypothetical protein [Verrucomicrobiota bacterium]